MAQYLTGITLFDSIIQTENHFLIYFLFLVRLTIFVPYTLPTIFIVKASMVLLEIHFLSLCYFFTQSGPIIIMLSHFKI